jgi:hypothetical protein
MIKGKITKTNFSKSKDWLFLVEGEDGQTYKILDSKGYKENRIKDPVEWIHLDSLCDGDIIEFTFVEKNGERIITKFHRIKSGWYNL